MVPKVVKSREGWELYIVTDGVVVGILLGEGAYWATCFGISKAETCRSVLSTNALNE
jgi:hypothetical protein